MRYANEHRRCGIGFTRWAPSGGGRGVRRRCARASHSCCCPVSIVRCMRGLVFRRTAPGEKKRIPRRAGLRGRPARYFRQSLCRNWNIPCGRFGQSGWPTPAILQCKLQAYRAVDVARRSSLASRDRVPSAWAFIFRLAASIPKWSCQPIATFRCLSRAKSPQPSVVLPSVTGRNPSGGEPLRLIIGPSRVPLTPRRPATTMAYRSA
jgi:hypothetical protein